MTEAALRPLPGPQWAAERLAQQEALAAVRAFVADPGLAILTLIGPNGIGKTHMAAIGATYAAQAGFHPLICLLSDLFESIRRSFSDPSEPDHFRAAQEVDFLVLDDMGSQQSTPWVSEKEFDLINNRYLWGRKTIITTNLVPKQLQPRVASRLQDAIRCRLVVMNGSDLRPHLRRLGA